MFSFNKLLVSALVLSFLVSLCYANNIVPADNLEKFNKWLVASGYHDDRVTISFIDRSSRLGVIATKDLKKGDVLYNIPKSYWLDIDLVSSDQRLQFFNGKWKSDTHAIIVWLLLEQENPKSYWKPWLDVLPTEFDTIDYWTEEQLKELKGSTVVNKHAQMNRILDQTYKELLEGLFIPHKDTGLFPEYLYDEKEGRAKVTFLYHLIQSRAWGISKVNPQGQYYSSLTAIPFSDMWNHDSAIGGFANFSGDVFTFTLAQDVREGEEIFLNYGPKGNPGLLTTYGFVWGENPHNDVEVTFDAPATAFPLSTLLLHHLGPKYGYFTSAREYRFQATGYLKKRTIATDLMNYIRYSLLSFDEYKKGAVDSLEKGQGVDLASEVKAFRSAISLLSSIEENFPTTIDEDIELLKELYAKHPDPNAREAATRRKIMAVSLRKLEKDLLRESRVTLRDAWMEALQNGKLITLPTESF